MPHITELEDRIKNDTLSIQHKKFTDKRKNITYSSTVSPANTRKL